jgi:hypothetical protein
MENSISVIKVVSLSAPLILMKIIISAETATLAVRNARQDQKKINALAATQKVRPHSIILRMELAQLHARRDHLPQI